MKRALLLTICLVGCADPTPPAPVPFNDIAPIVIAKQTHFNLTDLTPPELNNQVILKTAATVDAPEQNQNRNENQNKVQLQLKSGQTLESLLRPYHIDGKSMYQLGKTIAPYLPPKKLKIGQSFELTLQQQEVTGITVISDFDTQLQLTRQGNDWDLAVAKLATQKQLLSASGVINGSLYIAAQSQRVPIDVINRFILAFSHYVDFQREIQKGDGFRLVYSRDCLVSDITSHKVDQLKFAELTLSGQTTRLYNMTLADGNSAFYDEHGQLAQSFLLKTPVDGARLSSYFGRRKHPILGFSRAHNGLDFGAPIGTPIMAAGDATVEFAARNGSFGNMVKLKHAKGYETLYAHMKGFAKNLTVGQQVKQGDIIGYVGNSGLSQARHLHYEVHRYGKPLNPLKMKLDKQNISLTGDELAAFDQYRQQIASQFSDSQNQGDILLVAD